MAANLGFIYIKLNAEYTYYFKGGYTDCPERRLHDGISEHLEKSRFETIYEIINNESGEKCVDRIIFEFAEIENLSQYPNISNLRPYLLYKGSGTEFIDNKGKEIFKKCIEEDLIHFGVNVRKLSDEEVSFINDKPIPRSKMSRHIIDSLYKRLLTQLKEKTDEIPPNQQQMDVLEIVGAKYLTTDKLKLYWACGLGKALLGILIVKHLGFKKVVIGVPSIYLQKQMINEIKRIFPNKDNILCVGGNETNDISHIKKRMHSKETIFIITTYHSCELIQHLKGFDFKLGDEAHHLVGNITDTGFRSFHNIQSTKTLFMTATEKMVELKEEDETYSMDNTEQFGEYLDIKTVYWAIENKKITDYNVLLIKNTEAEIDEILKKLKIILVTEHETISTTTKKSLFTSCYMTLMSLTHYKDLTHILMYTNTIDEASLCTIYLYKLLPYFKSLNDIYIKDLHSRSNVNLEKEVEAFKESKYGIIPCIRIFGEGFDLPRLNGVCIASNMESEIRCVQALLRPNRIDKFKPDKIAYILLPYLVSMWDFESLSYKTVTSIIYQMRNIDEKIEQKIKVIELKSPERPIPNAKKRILYSEFEDKPDELSRIKIKLRHSKALISGLTQEENEYEFYKSVARPFQFKSSSEYVLASKTNDELKKDPDIYFKGIWREKERLGWYGFLSIDTTGLVRTKDEWRQFCKEKNIDSVQNYNDMCKYYKELPIEPNEYYVGFTNMEDELELELELRRRD
jgi:superfamily II DNA or RNA helicase